jgi:hypothetical protein
LKGETKIPKKAEEAGNTDMDNIISIGSPRKDDCISEEESIVSSSQS